MELGALHSGLASMLNAICRGTCLSLYISPFGGEGGGQSRSLISVLFQGFPYFPFFPYISRFFGDISVPDILDHYLSLSITLPR